MIGGHDDPGPRLLADLHRREGDVAQASHADLGEGEAGIVPAVHLHPRIDDPGTPRELVAAHAEERRVLFQPVGDLGGELVHPEIGHEIGHSAVHARISPLPSSARSPL